MESKIEGGGDLCQKWLAKVARRAPRYRLISKLGVPSAIMRVVCRRGCGCEVRVGFVKGIGSL